MLGANYEEQAQVKYNGYELTKKNALLETEYKTMTSGKEWKY